MFIYHKPPTNSPTDPSACISHLMLLGNLSVKLAVYHTISANLFASAHLNNRQAHCIHNFCLLFHIYCKDLTLLHRLTTLGLYFVFSHYAVVFLAVHLWTSLKGFKVLVTASKHFLFSCGSTSE